MISIPVTTPGGTYDVVIGQGVRHELADVLTQVCGPTTKAAAIITQRHVIDAGWIDDLELGIPHIVITIGDGEAAKNLATIEAVCSALSTAGISRADVIVGIGGGIVTDVAGFVAATYHRGISYVSVATTLLAQVDAAIGGKTGVNLAQGKNLVGAFWQPLAVLCDTQTLTSLAPREWSCGRGEMAKYAFLMDNGLDRVTTGDLETQIAACVELKAAVVGQDEREGGRRMILNYGHTLAHAIERVEVNGAHLDIRHGEAVGVGLLFAAQLAADLGRISAERVLEHRAVLSRFDLDGRIPGGLDHAALLELMGRDKKANHDLTFVLDGPAGVEVVNDIAPDQVLATLAAMERDAR